MPLTIETFLCALLIGVLLIPVAWVLLFIWYTKTFDKDKTGSTPPTPTSSYFTIDELMLALELEYEQEKNDTESLMSLRRRTRELMRESHYFSLTVSQKERYPKFIRIVEDRVREINPTLPTFKEQ